MLDSLIGNKENFYLKKKFNLLNMYYVEGIELF